MVTCTACLMYDLYRSLENNSRPLSFAFGYTDRSHRLPPSLFLIMEWYALLTTTLVIIYVAIRLLDKSDVPKIKNLPSIPEVPIFGNLLHLGEEHAKNTAKWAKKLGPVFQARLGNRVISSNQLTPNLQFLGHKLTYACLFSTPEIHFCKHLRFSQAFLDHQSIRSHLTSDNAHVSQRTIKLSGFHYWHLSMG